MAISPILLFFQKVRFFSDRLLPRCDVDLDFWLGIGRSFQKLALPRGDSQHYKPLIYYQNEGMIRFTY